MSQGFTKGTPIDTDPTLSLNSDIVVPSQSAVVAYVASQVSTGAVGSVTASAPILSSGGLTPNISIPVATNLVNGYLSATDWSIFNGKADLASPAFTGTPTAPTPPLGDNDTSIATTAFVIQAISTLATVNLSKLVAPVSVVNTTVNTLVYSYLIPANFLTVGNILTIFSNTNSTVPNGIAMTARYYINTSASLVGATLLGTFTNTVGTSDFYGFSRQFYVTSIGAPGNIKFTPSNTQSQLLFTSNLNQDIISQAVNTTVDQYLMLALQMGNAINTCSLQTLYLELR